jgi:hypothetical protein
VDEHKQGDLETDPRFPSGRWTGFFLQPQVPGRHIMELNLTFRNGVLTGEGRDWVGPFTFRGRYRVVDGKCHWTKRYAGKHDVFYAGYNEGKGIWGRWEIPPGWWHGGFHIWPEGMPDPSRPQLSASADLPAVVEEEVERHETVAVPLHSQKSPRFIALSESREA